MLRIAMLVHVLINKCDISHIEKPDHWKKENKFSQDFLVPTWMWNICLAKLLVW